MSEPTLTDIAGQLQEFKQTTEAQFQDLNRKVDALSQEIKEVKTAVDKLDSRLFELSMRIVTANSSAFFGVGIALLSAAIAFAESGGVFRDGVPPSLPQLFKTAVARISGGSL